MSREKEKIEIYRSITDIFLKAFAGVVAIVAFIALTTVFIILVFRKDYTGAGIVATVDGLFGVVIVLVYRHFFSFKS